MAMADGGSVAPFALTSVYRGQGELGTHIVNHLYPLEIALAAIYAATALFYLIHVIHPVPGIRNVYVLTAGAWICTAVYTGFWVGRPGLGVVFCALALAAGVFSYHEVTGW